MFLFIKKEKPYGLGFVAAATLLYLVVEFAFNSRLLDVVGGLPTTHEIESIERFGRIISGFALALAFWPTLLAKLASASLGKKAWIVGWVSVVLISLVYFVEKKLVDVIVDNSSAESRYVAVNLVALQNGLITQDVELEGLPLGKERLAEPDGKAFLATFPLLALSTSDLDRKIKKAKPAIIRNIVDRKYGGRAENFNRYSSSVKRLQESYNNDYVSGSNSYVAAINSIRKRQDDAWTDYEKGLWKYRQKPATMAKVHWDRIRRELRGRGVPVPSDWNPNDRYTFDAAIESKVKAAARKAYDEQIRKHFPKDSVGTLPPGSSFAAFVKTKTVQAAWKEKLQYPQAVYLSENFTSEKKFFQEVYSRVLDARVKEAMATYDASVDSFRDGNINADFGKNGMQIMVAAPIALVFSLTGAIVHVLKFAFFSGHMATGYSPRSGLVKTGYILGWVLVMFTALNVFTSSHITTQPLFQYFQERTIRIAGDTPSHSGRIVAYAIRGTIHGQNIAYPVFGWSRKNLLMGFRFGFQDKIQ